MIDIAKLNKVKKMHSKTIAQCPACNELGLDKTGDHLIIRDNGKFSCVANPGMSGSAHRRRIFKLAGKIENKPMQMLGVYRPARDRVCF